MVCFNSHGGIVIAVYIAAADPSSSFSDATARHTFATASAPDVVLLATAVGTPFVGAPADVASRLTVVIKLLPVDEQGRGRMMQLGTLVVFEMDSMMALRDACLGLLCNPSVADVSAY